MNGKRIFLVILIISLILPGLVHAETAGEPAGLRASDGSTYLLTEAEDGIIVLTAAGAEGSMLTVPPEIDGKTVKYLHAEYIPEQVTAVFLPAGAELYHGENLKREILVYSYRDYNMIHSQNSIMYYLAAVEPGEYALTDAKKYLPGGESELLQQEYYEYPVELNGRRLYNGLAQTDYFVIYRDSGFEYYKISENEIGICKCLGAGTRLEIPEQVAGMTVVALNALNSEWVIFAGKKTQSVTFPATLRLFGNHAFFTKSITAVRIPEGVTELGSYAVKGDKIQNITLPASVKVIGVNAMDMKAKTLKLPATVERISERAFVNSRYTAISLPEGMKAVPRDLCLNSMKLGRVDIPDSVERIGENAFKGCVKLATVTIPEGVTEIAAGAFSGCSNLKTVTFKGAPVRNIGEETFAGCGFSKLILNDGVEEIGRRAFAGCTRLSAAEIPESVATIGEGAFSGCKKLQNVKLTAGVQHIADDAFESCGKNLTFTVPDGSYAKQWAEDRGFKVKIAKQK